MRLAQGIGVDRPTRLLTFARFDARQRGGLHARLKPLFRRDTGHPTGPIWRHLRSRTA